MAKTVKMGLNMTGAQMSPMDTERMVDATESIKPDVRGSANAIAKQRGIYVVESERIGSVPVPGTAKGMVKSALDKLIGKSPEVLIDKLGERLAFERTGTRLYEALLAKADASEEEIPDALLRDLRRFHREEAQHLELVIRAMEQLGADPTAQTPSADVTGVASMGLLQVISDPRTSMAQCFTALLTAELTDNAGWELLIDLARQAGQTEMADSFMPAWEQEQKHLARIHDCLRDDLKSQLS
jgi:hypothetical protein